MNLIEAENVSIRQGAKYLLQDINWTVKEKEHWIVFGANGCGKTTLLSAVAGYRAYHKGSIKLMGETLNRSQDVLLRKQIGFVSSSYFDRCFQSESGLDIVLSAKFGGLGRQVNVEDEDVDRAMQLLTALGMKEKGIYPYNMLSQGQRQRVLLARAFMVPPKLLLLDEPVNGLDIVSRNYILNTLKDIADKTDAAIVYVTHHTEEILPFYNKAMLLKSGRVYAQGDIRDVFSSETLTGFFGNKANATWYDQTLHLEIEEDFKMKQTLWR